MPTRFTIYEVGGHVRDGLMGVESKDIDYSCVPEDGVLGTEDVIQDVFKELIQFLKDGGFYVFLVTPAMYTIRAKFPVGDKNEGLTADFVLARKELGYEKGTRRPIVVPGTLLDDLTRRDFTCNAIARTMGGDIIDPFNGQEDIRCKQLKTPIAAHLTFADDPLRLLRAIRFAITKGFQLSHDVIDILDSFSYEAHMGVVSADRIREELHKCFAHDTITTLRYLERYTILRHYIFEKTNLWLKPTNEKKNKLI